MAEKKEYKGFVNHSVKFIGKNLEFNLLQYGVLFDFNNKINPLNRCLFLQKQYRRQLSMAIALGLNKLNMTYVANCPPCGLKLSISSRLCGNPKVCPWCFVRRRLVPATLALREVPAENRFESKVIAWKRILPYSEDALRLFSKNYGPHKFLKAQATVQAILPFIDDGLKMSHVGVQIVDANCQHEKLLERLHLNFHVEPVANNDGIHRAIVFAFRLPWRNLFAKEQTGNFVKIMDDFNKRRLIRINKFKGESCGN